MAGSSPSPTVPAAGPSAADITLDQRLCLALYTASRAMTARYRAALGDLGLTYPQYLVMVLLWEEGEASVRDIGLRLRLDSSTLSPLLKRLQTMDLVTRRRDERDERLVVVGLTDRGRGLRPAADQVTLDVCEAAGMPVEQQLTLVETLRTLADQLETSTAGARSGTRTVAHDPVARD